VKKTTKKKKPVKITKGLLAYHIAASLVSTAPHPLTGRSVHHRHTSHGILLLALILTGVLLFSNLGTIRAYGLTNSGSSTISVSIAGAAPTIGADITYPANNTTTKSPQIQVVGTCEPNLLVATYNNGVFAGSSMCTGAGDYATIIQLTVGDNILQSQDYDGLNQPGPVTAQVLITRQEDPIPVTPTSPSGPSDPDVPVVATTPADVTPDATPPVIAPVAPQPAENPCYNASKTDELNPANPTIIANCINRSIAAGEKIILPIKVTGGAAPYALSINWGDGVIELKSVADMEYHDYEHVYQTAGIINVDLKTTDSKGATSFLQTVVQVNGSAATSASGSTSTFATITAGLANIWTEAPVPVYWAAVTLVVGFWVGDIVQRLLLRGKYAGGKHHPTHFNHHRHA
jgi:hypothetical protein